MRVALYNALSCGGCDLRFFLEELPEEILGEMEVCYWPELGVTEFAGDSSGPDLVFICGAVRTSEQEKMVRLLRERARFLVAVGACALHGGIPGLMWERGEGPRPVPEVVSCDGLIPGCPPEAETLRKSVEGLWKGDLSQEEKTGPLCEECPRRRQPFRIRSLVRVGGLLQREECFLARGIICSGPVTRRGCGAVCVRSGEPCRGCYGPLDPFSGERFLSALASGVLPARAEEFLKELVDPVGTLFRFSLAESPLLRVRRERS